MGVLKTLTDEYFGVSIREEDKIDISDLDVKIVSFTDNNGVEHRHGYRVKDGNSNEKAKTLKTLIERAIEVRGTECSLNDIDVSNIKKMCYKENEIIGVFEESSFNGDISGWDVSNVKNMSFMFWYAKSFNQPLDKWDVSNVKDMSSMFSGAESFNQDISGWDVSSVERMYSMFEDATSFNQDISRWNVSSVETMSYMFDNTPLKKNQKLPKWYLNRNK